MAYNVVTNRIHDYSRIGRCLECEAKFEDKETANRDAQHHTEKTGHETNVEVVTMHHYTAL